MSAAATAASPTSRSRRGSVDCGAGVGGSAGAGAGVSDSLVFATARTLGRRTRAGDGETRASIARRQWDSVIPGSDGYGSDDNGDSLRGRLAGAGGSSLKRSMSDLDLDALGKLPKRSTAGGDGSFKDEADTSSVALAKPHKSKRERAKRKSAARRKWADNAQSTQRKLEKTKQVIRDIKDAVCLPEKKSGWSSFGASVRGLFSSESLYLSDEHDAHLAETINTLLESTPNIEQFLRLIYKMVFLKGNEASELLGVYMKGNDSGEGNIKLSEWQKLHEVINTEGFQNLRLVVHALGRYEEFRWAEKYKTMGLVLDRFCSEIEIEKKVEQQTFGGAEDHHVSVHQIDEISDVLPANMAILKDFQEWRAAYDAAFDAKYGDALREIQLSVAREARRHRSSS